MGYKLINTILLSLLITSLGCQEVVFTPKPRGYFRIELPQKGYQAFSKPQFPYRFEYPTYARITQEEQFFDDEAMNPYWINVNFDSLSAKIYLSYNKINGKSDLEKLLSDSHFMSFYHSRRADFIEQSEFHTPNKVYGQFYTVGGNAASTYQFIATDSQKHFIRGAFYFEVTPNADSVLPVNQFLREDLEHLIKTLEWQP